MTMIHNGQDFARSKVIPTDNDIEDDKKGQLDHNSYNKDNSVNYINFHHADMNSNLKDYYKGLIEMRNTHAEFRRAESEQIQFFDDFQNELTIGFSLKIYSDEFIVLMNGDQNLVDKFTLPEGEWEVIVDSQIAGTEILKTISGNVDIQEVSGLVLKRK
jgi:pullulanase